MRYSLLSKYRRELMGIAMLSVMLYHATDLDLGIFSEARVRGFGGVDIFVMLSGMGLAMSLYRWEQSYGEFLGRRARRVLPAYYLVMLPYTLCLLLVKRATLSTFLWNSLLLNYWVRPRGSFNWYITGIFTFYIATPLLFRAFKNSRHPAGLALLVGAAGLVASGVLTYDGYWGHLDIAYRVPLYALGLLLGLWIARDKPFTWRDGVFWGVFLALGIGYNYIYDDFDFYLALCHLFVFTTVPACLGFCLLFDKLPLGPLRRALGFLGENSLEIYLLNVSFFSERDFLRRFFDPGPGHYAYYAAAFALNILCGWLLHLSIKWLSKNLPKHKKLP